MHIESLYAVFHTSDILCWLIRQEPADEEVTFCSFNCMHQLMLAASDDVDLDGVTDDLSRTSGFSDALHAEKHLSVGCQLSGFSEPATGEALSQGVATATGHFTSAHSAWFSSSKLPALPMPPFDPLSSAGLPEAAVRRLSSTVLQAEGMYDLQFASLVSPPPRPKDDRHIRHQDQALKVRLPSCRMGSLSTLRLLPMLAAIFLCLPPQSSARFPVVFLLTLYL